MSNRSSCNTVSALGAAIAAASLSFLSPAAAGEFEIAGLSLDTFQNAEVDLGWLGTSNVPKVGFSPESVGLIDPVASITSDIAELDPPAYFYKTIQNAEDEETVAAYLQALRSFQESTSTEFDPGELPSESLIKAKGSEEMKAQLLAFHIKRLSDLMVEFECGPNSSIDCPAEYDLSDQVGKVRFVRLNPERVPLSSRSAEGGMFAQFLNTILPPKGGAHIVQMTISLNRNKPLTEQAFNRFISEKHPYAECRDHILLVKNYGYMDFEEERHGVICRGKTEVIAFNRRQQITIQYRGERYKELIVAAYVDFHRDLDAALLALREEIRDSFEAEQRAREAAIFGD